MQTTTIHDKNLTLDSTFWKGVGLFTLMMASLIATGYYGCNVLRDRTLSDFRQYVMTHQCKATGQNLGPSLMMTPRYEWACADGTINRMFDSQDVLVSTPKP